MAIDSVAQGQSRISNLRGMDANSSVVWRKNVIEYEKKGCRHQLVITPAHVDASLGVSCTSDARQSVQCTSSSSEQARPFRGHRCFCGAFVVTSPKIWRCHWCHILLTLYPPYWTFEILQPSQEKHGKIFSLSLSLASLASLLAFWRTPSPLSLSPGFPASYASH